MLKFNWNKFNRFTAISEAEKQRLTELGFDNNKIDVVYNGGGNSKKILPRMLTDKKIILYIGRLSRPKNVDLLIDAFSKCHIDDSELIIAGPDFGALSYLKDKVRRRRLESKVIFKGRISEDEKYELLSRASLFVHPSLTDVFAITLIEASEAGVPCVAFNVGANNEIIENKVTGMLAGDSTPESLSKTIQEVLTNEKLAKKISDNGKNVIPSKFSWENAVKSLENTIQKTLI